MDAKKKKRKVQPSKPLKNSKKSKTSNANDSLYTVYIEALGSNPPKELEKDFSITHKEEFQKLFHKISDWAIVEGDETQTYEEFRSMERYTLENKKNIIYLQPIGNLNNSNCPQIESFREFVESYFLLHTKVLPSISVKYGEDNKPIIFHHPWEYPVTFKKSKDFKGMDRLYDMDILRIMKDFLPKDGFCIFGITMEDLYEYHNKNEKQDQIILGRGSGDRVGVVSLLRFDPKMKERVEISKKSKKLKEEVALDYTKEELTHWLLGACKTVGHEVMHMFGLDHCLYLSCCMNANAAPDSESIDTQENRDPLFLCPIDLRKLQTACKFDITEHYTRLQQWCKKYGSTEDVHWIDARLKFIH